MINKFYKIVNNKYSRFFKFVFFIRHLFIIFFVATTIFLTIPIFFDYKKKESNIKNYLLKNYEIKLKKIEKIKYKILPVPHLKLTNLNSNFHSINENFKIRELKIYPRLLNIYNYENFYIRKIMIIDSDYEIDNSNLAHFTKKLLKLKNNLFIENLNLKIKDKKNDIINLKKISYESKKKIINGKVFDKKFKIKLDENLNFIKFKILDTGISFTLDMTEDDKPFKMNGKLKGKILTSNFKSNFIYDEKSIDVNNFYFRNKDLSFNSEGFIKLNPFFKINLQSQINNINTQIFKNLNINHFITYKDLIKRLNSEISIVFEKKRFDQNLIDKLFLKTQLMYGRLEIKKELLITNSTINCQNNVNLSDEFPIIYFDCIINSPNKYKLMKKLKINNINKTKKNPLTLVAKGNLNIIKKKINFDKIEIMNSYKGSSQDLKFFKNKFENIFLDGNLFDIFQLTKVKRFILEIT